MTRSITLRARMWPGLSHYVLGCDQVYHTTCWDVTRSITVHVGIRMKPGLPQYVWVLGWNQVYHSIYLCLDGTGPLQHMHMVGCDQVYHSIYLCLDGTGRHSTWTWWDVTRSITAHVHVLAGFGTKLVMVPNKWPVPCHKSEQMSQHYQHKHGRQPCGYATVWLWHSPHDNVTRLATVISARNDYQTFLSWKQCYMTGNSFM